MKKPGGLVLTLAIDGVFALVIPGRCDPVLVQLVDVRKGTEARVRVVAAKDVAIRRLDKNGQPVQFRRFQAQTKETKV